MNPDKTLNIRNAIILIGIALLAKFILFGLVVLGIKYFFQPLPINSYSNYHLLTSLIIDLVTIIFAARFFNVDIKEQLNKISLTTTLLFSLLAILIFQLILPLVNPVDFFEKISNQKITTHQLDLIIFKNPNFYNIFYFFLMVIITPVIEEILYRGIILNLLLKKYSVLVSIILSSIIFAFIHLKFIGIGYLFLYGLLFGFAYYKTKSLFTSILLHFLINLMAVTTSHQYLELNSTTIPKYFLYTVIILTATFIVFNSLNKGANSIKLETKIILRKSKMPFKEIKEKSIENE